MVQNHSGPAPVLVIEDDPLLMMSLVTFVEDAGCEAVEATSVDKAIQILETRTDIRTVFADLDLQGANTGMKLAMSIRNRWPPIELLLISSQPWKKDQPPQRGILFGKPFDEERIVATIRGMAA